MLDMRHDLFHNPQDLHEVFLLPPWSKLQLVAYDQRTLPLGQHAILNVDVELNCAARIIFVAQGGHAQVSLLLGRSLNAQGQTLPVHVVPIVVCMFGGFSHQAARVLPTR